MTFSSVIQTNPEILGGTLVFAGTRVPLKNLMNYLSAPARPHRSAR